MSAQPTTVRDRICGHKVRHATREVAIEHSRRIWECNRYMTNVYHCEICGSWHVGGDARGGRQSRISAA
jgi:hypothetical protein